MKHQKRLMYSWRVLSVLYYGGLVCMLFSLFLQKMWPVYVGAVVVVLSVIFSDVLLRCPNCGEPLLKHKMHSIPRFCSNCGKQLRED